ncbi:MULTISPECIES: bile acid:sodium symporter family protein [unclassified Corynebacterium]|uniref:bile acid:sodium symporter family protein n=1 Tax=unclassified Corynebacterium TaxID=2624378 RepID=UPI0029CA2862|nr:MULTISPECIES: bile acid:sodium symporter family protein [unclassified Corynebacterium]WPF67046.1 bile acid:sodium symporter family protein [Corynebacterium sp. 22KM0430]WPF69534.1 bile acid:sodium symporter family protein [Corynebacterium sp. 21KM1197]
MPDHHASPTGASGRAATPPRQAEPRQADKQRRAYFLAAVGFPLLVVLGGLVGFAAPGAVSELSGATTWLLGLVMFAMGLSLRPADFLLVAARPWPVLLGVVAQYVIMPLAAVLVVWLLRLPPEIAAGVILVGCAPGGTSSNVVCLLARGDVALSVAMTSISTLLAPVFTPLLTLWLAGEYMPLQASSMALSIVQMVLIPVVGGLVVRWLFHAAVERILPALPWVSVGAIAVIVAIVVAGSRDKILSAGLVVLVAVILHNALGFLLGYGAAKVTGQSVTVRRTMSIEVGMQNSGLAAGLAAKYLDPLSALPGAVFSVWHNISGAIFAAACGVADRRREASGDAGTRA